jgi:uncharacterized protein with von Willebrand factor type A (vWA) domain
MSKDRDDIKEELRKFASQFGPAAIKTATVKEVNDNDTITVLLNDVELDDVRLRAVIKDGNKCLLLPAVNSTVLIGRIDNSEEWVVLAVEEIDSVEYVFDEVEFKINEEGFCLKKQNTTLKSALIKLVESLEPIMILQGNNPNFIKMAEAKTQIENLLQ